MISFIFSLEKLASCNEESKEEKFPSPDGFVDFFVGVGCLAGVVGFVTGASFIKSSSVSKLLSFVLLGGAFLATFCSLDKKTKTFALNLFSPFASVDWLHAVGFCLEARSLFLVFP